MYLINKISKIVNNINKINSININDIDGDGNTSLILAVKCKKIEKVKEQLQNSQIKADTINYINNAGENALLIAMTNNTYNIVMEFLKNKLTDVNILDSDDNNTFIVAFSNYTNDKNKKNNLEIMIRLANNKNFNVNFTIKDKFLLHIIGDHVLNNNDEELNKLFNTIISHDEININVKNEYKETILQTAIVLKNQAIINILLTNKNLDVNGTYQNGNNILTYMIANYNIDGNINSPQKNIYDNLLKHVNMNVNSRNTDNRTPLIYATKYILSSLWNNNDIDINILYKQDNNIVSYFYYFFIFNTKLDELMKKPHINFCLIDLNTQYDQERKKLNMNTHNILKMNDIINEKQIEDNIVKYITDRTEYEKKNIIDDIDTLKTRIFFIENNYNPIDFLTSANSEKINKGNELIYLIDKNSGNDVSYLFKQYKIIYNNEPGIDYGGVYNIFVVNANEIILNKQYLLPDNSGVFYDVYKNKRGNNKIIKLIEEIKKIDKEIEAEEKSIKYNERAINDKNTESEEKKTKIEENEVSGGNIIKFKEEKQKKEDEKKEEENQDKKYNKLSDERIYKTIGYWFNKLIFMNQKNETIGFELCPFLLNEIFGLNLPDYMLMFIKNVLSGKIFKECDRKDIQSIDGFSNKYSVELNDLVTTISDTLHATKIKESNTILDIYKIMFDNETIRTSFLDAANEIYEYDEKNRNTLITNCKYLVPNILYFVQNLLNINDISEKIDKFYEMKYDDESYDLFIKKIKMHDMYSTIIKSIIETKLDLPTKKDYIKKCYFLKNFYFKTGCRIKGIELEDLQKTMIDRIQFKYDYIPSGYNGNEVMKGFETWLKEWISKSDNEKLINIINNMSGQICIIPNILLFKIINKSNTKYTIIGHTCFNLSDISTDAKNKNFFTPKEKKNFMNYFDTIHSIKAEGTTEAG